MSKENFFGDGLISGEPSVHITTSTQERASVRKIWRNITGFLLKVRWRKKKVKMPVNYGRNVESKCYKAQRRKG